MEARMNLHNELFTSIGGLAIATAVRKWMGTLDYQVSYYDQSVDPANRANCEPAIYIFWHEYISFPLYLRGHNRFALLLSQHRDAEWLSRTAHHLGFQMVRGSTFRGGGKALRELLRKSEDTNIAITPDGPRGPRRKLAQGPIYVASKLQRPLVLQGFAFDQPWRTNTWDRFAIPRPYSRARAVVSPYLRIPPNLDRAGIEHYRQHVEKLLNHLSDEAQAWATSGKQIVGQQPGRRQSGYVHPPQGVIPAPRLFEGFAEHQQKEQQMMRRAS
jgi:lysophospholipid acyltransferase (LPLAT)-like uncharacterized protein